MSVVILDIESSNISVIVGDKGINNTYSIKAKESVEYYSFFEGSFYDTKDLALNIKNLLNDLKIRNGIDKIDRIFVGVPGEFCKVKRKSNYITFRRKKVTTNEINELIKSSFEEIDPEYAFIHVSAIKYICDDKKFDYPVGIECTRLQSTMSFVFAKLYFKETLDTILHDLGINKICYISTDYCECRYLFENNLNSFRILVDSGCSTTSISIAFGDGLLSLDSIQCGGGIIAGNLSNELECNYFVADELRKKINLGLSSSSYSSYNFEYEGESYTFPVDKVNGIVIETLGQLAESIYKATQNSNLEIPCNTPMWFTGGGVCYIRGAIEHFSDLLNFKAEKKVPLVPRFNQASYSSIISLLATCIVKKDDKTFFYNM